MQPVLLVLSVVFGLVTSIDYENKLLTDLLKGRDARIRPIKSTSTSPQPVHAKFAIGINDLMEVRPTLWEIQGWLKQSWTDEHFVWQPEKYGGIKHTIIHPFIPGAGPTIWTPDITLYNGRIQQMDTIPPRAMITHNGTVTWLTPCVFKLRCQSIQSGRKAECKMRFGSWMYSKRDLEVHHDGNLTVENYLSFSSPWELINFQHTKEYSNYPGFQDPFPYVDLVLKFSKESD